MEPAALFLFAASYLAVLIVPGPGVTALVARVLAQGIGCAPAFTAGVILGALIWFTLAATGLSLLAARFAMVFEVVRYLGAAWLLYLAWQLWRAPARTAAGATPAGATPAGATPAGATPAGATPAGAAPAPVAAREDGRQFLAGLAINLGNPKAMAFFLALLPAVVDLGTLTVVGFLELALAIILVAGSVLMGYAMAAARARRLFTSALALRRMRRGSSVAMAGAAAGLLAR
ncbi:LysE family translocator [Roseomonas frigidaquae]|uniref:LysE family translocator n=1 Tax=Falsiroseomonas frigidaquae TaxID=487318 RepID=A0ABX1EXX6_9PROT|nr:LysE family translocator [Falsiroseomonas frigidaquae]NKE44908.1 LysE family translocator [Falsiroseomonas frigidaquae]